MQINWPVVATIASPIVAGIIVVYISRAVESRPNLLTWLVTASTVTIRTEQNQNIPINSHSIVVRNAGRRPAHNVSLIHALLPHYSVHPGLWHQRRDTPSGGGEILFPTLAPNEQVTVTYLYFPPLTWAQVNQVTRSDEGPARVLNVIPSIQYPRWAIEVLRVLLVIGLVTSVYLMVQFGFWIASVQHK